LATHHILVSNRTRHYNRDSRFRKFILQIKGNFKISFFCLHSGRKEYYCFEVLLEDASLPAIVNSQDNEGNTALHLAVQLGEQQQKVNSQGNEGNTALHLAVRYGITLTSFSYAIKMLS